MDTLAKIISIVFQPLFVPLYGMLLLFNCHYFYFDISYKVMVFLGFTIGVCIIPLVCSLFLYSVQSLTKLEREKRHFIYIITLIAYIFTGYLLMKIHFPFSLLVMYAGCVITVFLLTVINFFWKISAHATVVGCLCGYVFLVNLYTHTNPYGLFCIIILLVGIVGWARLRLQAHTLAQVLFGYILGVLPSLLSIPLFL